MSDMHEYLAFCLFANILFFLCEFFLILIFLAERFWLLNKLEVITAWLVYLERTSV